MGIICVSKAAAKKKLNTCGILKKTVLTTQKRKRCTMDSDSAANCKVVLEKLMKHDHSYPFSDPVAVVGFRDSDYFDVIKHPMDLGTVKTKLYAGKYSDAVEFGSDVRLTFDNAMIYNPRYNLVHHYAEELTAIFDDLWKPIMAKETAVASKDVKTTRCCLDNNKNTTMSTKRKVSHAGNKKASVLNSKRVSADQVSESKPTMSEVCYQYEEGEIHDYYPQKKLQVSKLKRQFTGSVLKVQEKQPSTSSGSVRDTDQVNKNKQKKVVDSEVEVKLVRQKEREAARMALEKMEKSIEFEDNFQVMREMEALVGFPLDYQPLWPGVDRILKSVSDDHVSVPNLNKPDISEAGSHSQQQGTENEVPSSRALRVAALKSRFLGTILKAHQTCNSHSQLGDGKTTNQDKTAKFEKEKAKQVGELEMEVKRYRQKEREAARMELERVERSVDVQDNFRVMREMETLFGYPVAYAPLWVS